MPSRHMCKRFLTRRDLTLYSFYHDPLSPEIIENVDSKVVNMSNTPYQMQMLALQGIVVKVT